MYRNKALELRGEESGEAGRGCSMEEGLGEFFEQGKNCREQLLCLAGMKGVQVLIEKKRGDKEHTKCNCGS